MSLSRPVEDAPPQVREALQDAAPSFLVRGSGGRGLPALGYVLAAAVFVAAGTLVGGGVVGTLGDLWAALGSGGILARLGALGSLAAFLLLVLVAAPLLIGMLVLRAADSAYAWRGASPWFAGTEAGLFVHTRRGHALVPWDDFLEEVRWSQRRGRGSVEIPLRDGEVAQRLARLGIGFARMRVAGVDEERDRKTPLTLRLEGLHDARGVARACLKHLHARHGRPAPAPRPPAGLPLAPLPPRLALLLEGRAPRLSLTARLPFAQVAGATGLLLLMILLVALLLVPVTLGFTSPEPFGTNGPGHGASWDLGPHPALLGGILLVAFVMPLSLVGWRSAASLAARRHLALTDEGLAVLAGHEVRVLGWSRMAAPPARAGASGLALYLAPNRDAAPRHGERGGPERLELRLGRDAPRVADLLRRAHHARATAAAQA